jgi:magnesium transporter
MRVRLYVLYSGALREEPAPATWSEESMRKLGETWLDVEEVGAGELRPLLAPLDLHPLQLSRCLDKVNDPGVVAFGESVLVEYPAAFDQEADHPAFLTILLHDGILVTIRHGPMVALDTLIRDLTAEKAPPLLHLPQIIYLILDHFADLNVGAQTAIRDQMLDLAQTVAERPRSVKSESLSRLRWQVGNLVALVEDQLYCISGLSASDSEALRDPHRKAYLQDLMSETEIAQRGVYRLETRLNDLYRDYQLVSSDQVERRLRLLTIVSAITLPLGLVAGLLGMNVGGLPGTSVWFGFLLVVVLMLVIALLEYWYFRSKGWFD